MKSNVLAFALGLALGLGLTLLFFADVVGVDRGDVSEPSSEARSATGRAAGGPPEAGPGGESLESTVLRLRDELTIERAMREELSEEISRIRDGEAAEIGAGPDAEGSGPPPEPEEIQPHFKSDVLVSLGYHPRDVERIHDVWQAYTLERLNLQDAHRRSDTAGNRLQHRREIVALERDLKNELGERDYDAMLYATGEPNRVVLNEVIEDSPGDHAGLRPGDEVIRYAGRRVYRGIGLKLATTAGEKGETVEIEVLRDGELERFFVERGPLGVFFKQEPRAPY